MSNKHTHRNTLTRREFLKSTALGTAGVMGGLLPGCSALQGGTKAGRGRPNVLFIICDDLNDTVDGMGGHPQAKTPNIKRLMRRGVHFTNAHCNGPICAPSRASLWTGLYPSTTGYYGYKQQENHWRRFDILRDARTMMEHFRDNGYDVCGTGKIFHNGHEDNTVWRRPDGFNGLGVKPSFGPFPWDGKSRHPWGAMKGTGHSSMPPSMRDSYWGSFAPLSDIPVTPADPKKGTPGYTGWILDRKPFRYVSEKDRDLMPDELNAKWAVERLQNEHKRPFFLAVGMNRPHVPRYAPKKHFDMFPLEDVQLPPYLENDLEDCAEILWKNPATGKRLWPSRALPNLLRAGGEQLWRRWVQSYLACAAFVDEQIGKILDALYAGRYGENTIVIFTGDHGYHMGEKDNLAKTTIWEESTRVPLVVSVPGVTKGAEQCDQPVSLVDMYPSVIDLCGLPADPNGGGNGVRLDGHSIRPFLENPQTTSWDGPSVALNSRHGPDKLEKNEPGKVERQHFSVRSRRWRYTLCCNGEEELYDHKNDPHEWTNLAGQVQYADVKRRLRRELCRLTGLPQS